LNLDLLASEAIRPALESEKIPWYGWHAFRRGLATNLHRLGVSPSDAPPGSGQTSQYSASVSSTRLELVRQSDYTSIGHTG
jgi:hypothetical protein